MYTKATNQTEATLDALVVNSLSIPETPRSALYLDNTQLVRAARLNLGEVLMGRNGQSPLAGTFEGLNGIKVLKDPGVIKIEMDPDADITFHDITASGDVSTGDLKLAHGELTLKGYYTPTARTATIPNVGDNAEFVMTKGPQTIAGGKTFTNGLSVNNYASVYSLLLGTGTGSSLLRLQGFFTDTPVTYTFPNVGGNAEVVMTKGNQAIDGEKTFKDDATFEADTVVNELRLAGGALTIQGYFTSFPRYVTIPNVGASADFVLTAGDQTIGGTKTFSGNISAANLSGTNTGNVTIGSVGGGNANGASLSGQALSLHAATSTQPGILTTGAQTIAGNKTFSGTVTASNLSGTNTGDVTVTTVGTGNANGMSVSGQVLRLHPATSTQPGILTTGTQTIKGDKTFDGSVTTPVLVLNATRVYGHGTVRNVTIPNPGANSDFVLTEGNQTINGSKHFSNLSATSSVKIGACTVQSVDATNRTYTIPNVGSSGTVMVKPPITNITLSYQKNSDQSLVPNANIVVSFVGVWGDSDLTFNGTRWTCNRAGWYFFDAHVLWADSTVGTRWLFWGKNAQTTNRYGLNSVLPTGNVQMQASQANLYLGVGDFMELIAYQTSGGSLALRGAGVSPNHSKVWVHRIHG
jgi:hypothetical protein